MLSETAHLPEEHLEFLAYRASISFRAMTVDDLSPRLRDAVGIQVRDAGTWRYHYVGSAHCVHNGYRLQGEMWRHVPQNDTLATVKIFDQILATDGVYLTEQVGNIGNSRDLWTRRITAPFPAPKGADAATISICTWEDRNDVLPRGIICDALTRLCGPDMAQAFWDPTVFSLSQQVSTLNLMRDGAFGPLGDGERVSLQLAQLFLFNRERIQ